MSEPLDFTPYYNQLLEIYKEKYPHNPAGVLYYHIKRQKLPIETSILILAAENEIQIPEIQEKVTGDTTLQEACAEVAKLGTFDESIIAKYQETQKKKKSKAYIRTSIDQITQETLGKRVAVYGRVTALYVGRRIEKDTGKVMLFTLSDGTGMILVEAKDMLNQTLMRGSIVKINGETRSHEDNTYILSSSTLRLQTVEDGYQGYVDVPLSDTDKLPENQDGRLVKPPEAETAESVTVERKNKSDYLLYGGILCCFSIIPGIGILTCIAGSVLLCMGLTTKELNVTSWDKMKNALRLAIEHHPPWLRDRCLHIRVLGVDIYPCARCTGTILGLLIIGLSSVRTESPLALWLLALPAFLDWGTQKLGLRESNNKLRLLSGFMLGSASYLVQPMSIVCKVSIITSYVAMSAFITHSSSLHLMGEGEPYLMRSVQ